MAQVNLGSIKFNWKGAYNAGTAYAIDDVVSYNGSSYIAKTATTGNLPTVTANWDIMSSAGTNGTNGTDLTSTLTTQGDIVYRDGSGLQRLGAGTSGQFLKTLGTGANPIWGDVAGGIKQIKFASSTGTTQYTTSSSSFVDVGANYQVTITPTSASNRILIYTQFADQGTGGRAYYNFNKSGDSSSNGDLIPNGGWANVENVMGGAGNGYTSGMMVDNSIQSTNALTYKLRFKNGSSSTTHVNVADSISFMMAMELDGGLF
jgi:hypothetical protein